MQNPPDAAPSLADPFSYFVYFAFPPPASGWPDSQSRAGTVLLCSSPGWLLWAHYGMVTGSAFLPLTSRWSRPRFSFPSQLSRRCFP
eukprot:scaffold245_cov256-Pinguiococcus_pyrenoidosus.AAC.52